MMNLRVALFISFLPINVLSPTASFADDNRVSLVPVVESSYCTFEEYDARYEVGVVGTDWALTFDIPKDSFSGKVHVKTAYLYRGPDIRRYIRQSAGPARPLFPTTKAYTKVELAGIDVDIHRVKAAYDKVMGPIEVLVNDFVANSQQFYIPGRINIVCHGPLP